MLSVAYLKVVSLAQSCFPVLFIIYVNDICDTIPIEVTVKLFADDTKIYSTLSDHMSAECLQACLDVISSWSDHWQLTLSPSKCTVLHVVAADKCRARFPYTIAGYTLSVVESVTDFGITYDNKLKFGPHIDKVCSKASSRAKLILKCFQTRSPSILLKAYCTFVRPILEYASVVWSPYNKCDINKIEAVQRYFTKRLGGLGHMSYCLRLSVLELDSLHLRRIKADLLLCYKMINNLVDVDVATFFTLSDCRLTRSNGVKLQKSFCCSTRDANFFQIVL